ncbi:conserved Plasmodium protein, unknown function [Plasmodium gallinaceum]|uniref:Uncharacterized protein n=1 Tax=Plasmodium gallinaceum TaxID=5849 RepID=A0A1J1H190_PLAGA|nr:conserved Plasmodium protein, unknown function [Plasmodium gallinaceum]CRG97299.1 conserved Plasmodium protein, unknown function [Plasmodium gallinaceum]
MEHNNEEDIHNSSELKSQFEDKEKKKKESNKDINSNLIVCEEKNENNMESQVLNSRKEMPSIANLKENANIFAEHIAKQAKMKASEFISKNDRVQQEFSGIGMNTNQQNSMENNYINIKDEYVIINDSEDENQENLNEKQRKKKILIGAKPVMPTGDKELLEKLKQRRI